MQTISEKTYANVDCKEIHDGGGAGEYLSKYTAKDECTILGNYAYHTIPKGRCWGVLRSKSLPLHDVTSFILPPSALADRVYSYADKIAPTKRVPRRATIQSVGPAARELLAVLLAEELDELLPDGYHA
jgi:hypothetical protein